MIDCTACSTPTDALALFPGGLCVDCWAKTDEANRDVTADELAAMFRGSVR